MNNIELFDLCDDLQVPRIPYSNCMATWTRWKAEGKHCAIHADGYVSVDYPEAREECITVKDYQIDHDKDNILDIDINLFLLVSKITIPSYKLYFLTFRDNPSFYRHQLISGITTNE